MQGPPISGSTSAISPSLTAPYGMPMDEAKHIAGNKKYSCFSQELEIIFEKALINSIIIIYNRSGMYK
jgi:hypothetical protein